MYSDYSMRPLGRNQMGTHYNVGSKPALEGTADYSVDLISGPVINLSPSAYFQPHRGLFPRYTVLKAALLTTITHRICILI